jgi:hypothetical protein
VRDNNWPCVTNMNLVCDPDQSDQLLPFARLAKDLGVHYAIIKHCWVDTHMDSSIHVDYKGYERIGTSCSSARRSRTTRRRSS